MCAAAALETLHVVIVHLSSNVSLKSPSSLQAHAAGTRVDRGGHVMREVGCMARAAHSPLPVRHATPGATICRHFLQGRCAFGSRLTAVKLVDNSKSDGPRPCESSGRSCSKVTHAATSTRCRSRCRRFRRLQWRTATAVARTWTWGDSDGSSGTAPPEARERPEQRGQLSFCPSCPDRPVEEFTECGICFENACALECFSACPQENPQNSSLESAMY